MCPDKFSSKFLVGFAFFALFGGTLTASENEEKKPVNVVQMVARITYLSSPVTAVRGASLSNSTDFVEVVEIGLDDLANNTVINDEVISLNTLGVTEEFNSLEAGCHLSKSLVDEIRSHGPVVDRIVDYVLDADKHETYRRLEEFVDLFGSRLTGSRALEDSISFLLDGMKAKGLDNVRGEEVTVPRWVRGKETLTMLEPRAKKMAVLGLGGTIGTPPEGIKAEAVVVTDFDDLQAKKDQVKGKIVVFAYKYENYSQGVQYRYTGGTKASQLGAVAALISSCTDFSLYTPHTGLQVVSENTTAIPSASITVEDAQMLLRLAQKGKKVVLHLLMEEENLASTISRNAVAEIRGDSHPEELVIIGGHTDSWDVGQGAMDDGGGVMISVRALEILKKLELRPKRTLRSVLWTAEEVDLIGAEAYYQARKDEADNISIAMESDYGTFKPLGLSLHASLDARCVVKEILNLFSSNRLADADKLFIEKNGPDLTPWMEVGVPTASLKTANARYFYYHHTEADTMTMMNPDHLDQCLALWTATSYVLANLEDKINRE